MLVFIKYKWENRLEKGKNMFRPYVLLHPYPIMSKNRDVNLWDYPFKCTLKGQYHKKDIYFWVHAGIKDFINTNCCCFADFYR